MFFTQYSSAGLVNLTQ